MTNIKVRSAVVISITKDKYNDVLVSAISSVIPENLSPNELVIDPDDINNLRTKSIIKVDRIVTWKKENIITKLGKLSNEELKEFIRIFKNLVK